MDENIYLHTIYNFKIYKTKKTLDILEKILKSNAVLSRKNIGLQGSVNFCGEDYISLCDYEKRNECKSNYYNAYYLFGRFFTSIIFPKDKVEVYQPIILEDKISKYSSSLSLMKELGESKIDRYTDLPDEVQAKDIISLDNMSGFMIPCYNVMNFWKNDSKNEDRIKNELETYKGLFIKYGKDVPIYDTITNYSLDNEEGINDTVKTLRLMNRKRNI